MTSNDRSDSRAGSDAAYDAFRFDCTFCEEVFQSDSAERLKDRSRAHLETHEDAELLPAFADTYGGNDCRDDCGYVFPVGVEEVSGFDCPNCGHDNFQSFAERYLYWEIEAE